MTTGREACAHCEALFAPIMLSDEGLCPRCDAQYRAVKRQEARKDRPPPAVEPEQRRQHLARAQQEREDLKSAREDAAEEMVEFSEQHRNRIEAYRQAHPALVERYESHINDEDPPEPEETSEKAQERLEARKELAMRELARRHFLPYVRYTTPNYLAGWVHKDICKRLERFSRQVANGESPRLMLLLPPRHGKSLLATQKFPAWHLGNYSEHEFITASYSASLANKFSKSTRAILRSEDHKNVFGAQLDEDDASVEGWSTVDGGAYFPTGVGGPATGRGANIFVIDDPVKNREEADSETIRETIKDWYTSTAYTRLSPGGGVLVIQTCWHDDDLAGWLQHLSDTDEGDHFEVICYPAIAEHDEKHRKKGEPLHPERYPLSALERIKKAIGPRDWSALYQQNPIPDSGDFFQRDDLRFYEMHERPALDDLAIYAACDFAIGEKQENDSTVIYIAGIDRDMRMWILDRYKGQWGSLNIIKNLCLAHNTWEPEMFGGERGHIEQTLNPMLNEYKFRPEYNAPGMFLRPLKPGRNDKRARARPFQGMVEQHQVYFPKHAPWLADALSEILRFDAAKHDDDVDALAWLGKMIDLFSPVPAPPQPKKRSWRDNLDKYVKHGSSGKKRPMAA